MKKLEAPEAKRILVASHQKDEISLIESRLRARNYEVEAAETSLDVIHRVNRSHFDLILLDAKMEDVRHTELAELLRRRSILRTIPIVMIADRDDITHLISSVDKGFDDFYIRPIDPLSLQLRVAVNIRRSEEKLETNPLSQLPGNVAIEKTVRHLIEQGALFSMVYADLNHFKALNDFLGYKKGDDILKQTAFILESNAKRFEGKIPSFVGHVGGDDFILVVCPTVAGELVRNIIQDFDRIMLTYYPPEVREQGFIEVKNRKGVLEKFPLLSLSVAEVSNEYIPITSPSEAANRLTEVKKFLKTQAGSSYLKDRRGQPFKSIDEAVDVLKPFTRETSDPLGQLLLKAGVIREEDLNLALEKHFETGQRLGQILASLNLVPPQEIGRMLERKLGVPYVSLSSFVPQTEVLDLFNENFIKSRQVVPLEIKRDRKLLYLGMVDPSDEKARGEVEEITGLQVKKCLVLENEFEENCARFFLALVEQ